MKLEHLYGIQSGLKARIGYKGEDKLEKMMLAMLVEFMECANDWQGFKYWKQKPEAKATLLEEYVDGLHFILETGLDLLEDDSLMALPKEVDSIGGEVLVAEEYIVKKFKSIIKIVLLIEDELEHGVNYVDSIYYDLFEEYLILGALLGFNEKEIEAAYLEKNKENHDRQDRGY